MASRRRAGYIAILLPGVVVVLIGNWLGPAYPQAFFLPGIVIGVEMAAIGMFVAVGSALRLFLPRVLLRLRPAAPRSVSRPMMFAVAFVGASGVFLLVLGSWVAALSFADVLLPLDARAVDVERVLVTNSVRGGMGRYLIIDSGERLEAPLFARVFADVAPGKYAVLLGHTTRQVVAISKR
jgi:hypothetical protein